MIVVDASAVLAIHLGEPERDEFSAKLLQNPALISSVNHWEILVRAEAIDGARGRDGVERLMASYGVEVAAIDASISRSAADAFVRFGRNTPAGLNLGDCFAYALAKERDAPLLYKGNDFAKTDVQAV